jgi:hypothetical protein
LALQSGDAGLRGGGVESVEGLLGLAVEGLSAAVCVAGVLADGTVVAEKDGAGAAEEAEGG